MANNASDLRFGRSRTNNADLVFGDTSGGASVSQVSAQVAFPEFVVHALTAPKRTVNSRASFPDFAIAIEASYDIRVDRPVVGNAQASWKAAAAARTVSSHGWAHMVTRNGAAQAGWVKAAHLGRGSRTIWEDSRRMRAGALVSHGVAQRLPKHPIRANYEDAIHLRQSAEATWQNGADLRMGAQSPWQEMNHTARLTRSALWQHGKRQSRGTLTAFGTGKPIPCSIVARWQEAMLPALGRWAPGTDPVTPPRISDPDLLFRKPAGSGPHLVFNWSPDKTTTVIPIRRTYVVYNTVTLRRTDSNTEVQALSLDIGIDDQSWAHSWSAEVAFNEWPALAAENGETLELEAVVNGHTWVLLAEGAPARSRSFGKTTVRIRGRGIAAWLDAPSAASVSHYNATAMNAQQLMAQALTTNGVSLGWDLDWQIEDWLVPAGAWSVQGTPIAGVLDVAGAVQAIVQADASQKILHVLPRYPAAPWEWNTLTPDIEIPPDILITDSLEPITKTDYNAVYVSGQTQGVLARVLRSGTAGDKAAPMVTHPLITASEAARQRGLAVLGDAGRQARVSISLPISDDTTLLRVGPLAHVSEPSDPWRGLIRGVNVAARWDDSSGLSVTQTAELERHYA